MTSDAAVRLRADRAGGQAAVREVVVAAFGEDQPVGDLVDGLRSSAAWIDGLSFVAEREGRVVGHVLLTRGLLDAPSRLVDVLVLSPLAVDPHCSDTASAPSWSDTRWRRQRPGTSRRCSSKAPRRTTRDSDSRQPVTAASGGPRCTCQTLSVEKGRRR